MNLSSLLRLATTHLDSNRGGEATTDLACAEVDADGKLVTVNPLASTKWGWEPGNLVHGEMRIALEGLAGKRPTELPLKLGGLHIGAVVREKDGGWFLFGYNPEESESLKSTGSLNPIHDAATTGPKDLAVIYTKESEHETVLESSTSRRNKRSRFNRTDVQGALSTLRLLATTTSDVSVFCDAALREITKALGVERVLFFVRNGNGNLVLGSSGHARLKSDTARLELAGDHPIFQLVEARGSGTPVNRAIAPVICSQVKCDSGVMAAVRDHNQLTGYLFVVLEGSGKTGKGTLPLIADRTGKLATVFGSLYASLSQTSRYRSMVAALDDVVFSFQVRTDGSRAFGFVSERIEKFSGFLPEELTGERGSAVKWIEHIVHEEDRDLVRKKAIGVLAGEECVADYRIVHRNGSIRWVREHTWPHVDAVGVQSITGILKDVSEVKAVEAMVEGARKEAEVARRFKTAFIATMSHEVRTPLGALTGYAQLLKKELLDFEEESGETLPDQIHEFADVLTGRSQKLQGLVHDLFELSNLEMGGATVNRRSIELNDVVRLSASKVSDSLKEKGVVLDLDLCPSEPTVFSDHQYLGQIVDHLLSNAAKFTDRGSVTIRTLTNANKAVLEVSDTGIGMSDDYQGDLFEAFSQEENWRNRRFEGTGLGLTLSRRLIDLLDGQIEVESEKGEGSTFRVLLPLVKS